MGDGEPSALCLLSSRGAVAWKAPLLPVSLCDILNIVGGPLSQAPMPSQTPWLLGMHDWRFGLGLLTLKTARWPFS